MTTEHDPRTRIVLSWLREDAHENPEHMLLRALDEVDATPQRRSWWPAWRSNRMNTYAKLIVAAAAVLVVAVRRLPAPAAQWRRRRRADDRAIAEPVPARPWQLHRTGNNCGARCDRKRRRRRRNDVLVRVRYGQSRDGRSQVRPNDRRRPDRDRRSRHGLNVRRQRPGLARGLPRGATRGHHLRAGFPGECDLDS